MGIWIFSEHHSLLNLFSKPIHKEYSIGELISFKQQWYVLEKKMWLGMVDIYRSWLPNS